MDKATVFGINGSRVTYSVMLVNRESGIVQVAGPKLNRFFGYSGGLTEQQLAMLPESCIETLSLSKQEPGWYAYTARPVPGGLKVLVPLDEYQYETVIFPAEEVEALLDYIQTALNSPLYIPESEKPDEF